MVVESPQLANRVLAPGVTVHFTVTDLQDVTTGRMEGQDECGETYNFGSRRVLRPPIDPWGATIIEAENWAGFYCYFCSEERNTSFSGPKFWKAKSSALPRPSLRSFSVLGYFRRCQGNGTNTGATPVGAYRLDPPTAGR
ncbi:hypothetical protein Bbelb_410300 [Branchiostoma belcheri]|nr:hypothetical protein Bbelb_410300 [Branchiostoma belcheri]